MVPRGIQGTIGLTGLTGNHRIQGGWKSISKLVQRRTGEYKESEAIMVCKELQDLMVQVCQR
jgi:hypothetical protein